MTARADSIALVASGGRPRASSWGLAGPAHTRQPDPEGSPIRRRRCGGRVVAFGRAVARRRHLEHAGIGPERRGAREDARMVLVEAHHARGLCLSPPIELTLEAHDAIAA